MRIDWAAAIAQADSTAERSHGIRTAVTTSQADRVERAGRTAKGGASG